MKRARIILADDHGLILDGLKNLIETEYDVVGTFQDGHSLVEGAAALAPDVVVLDIGMPRMNGLLAGELLKEAMPHVKLIYMTMNRYADLAAEAFQLGASGYLLKSSAGSELLHAISEALLGRSYITPLLANGDEPLSIRELKLQKKHPRLTVRQKEILQLLAEGRTMKEIAFMLDLSPRTIAFHKYSMMSLLDVKSSAELVQFAAKNSMVAV
jgi:DNA-binding NarL/FixJ family response regulator